LFIAKAVNEVDAEEEEEEEEEEKVCEAKAVNEVDAERDCATRARGLKRASMCDVSVLMK
jgi:hypothetical protein